ncbi:hypothetical protein ANCCAN_17270 [Ancylostoma caninum]|uniref:Carboxylesterase type B domain-containing protein n=1 Tax=Ancylostoma caninum TaxID=29170 RepID=A0A368FXD6_ANCCA|nr:hypothetical protein ANCCAN_17270 [Ancylostoma caninum]
MVNWNFLREDVIMQDGHSRGYEVRSVNTAWGIVKGELVNPDGGDLAPVTQFLGVPYGVAPSGQFRFNMAISAAKWTHLPKEARKLSPACIQTQLPELSETRFVAVLNVGH